MVTVQPQANTGVSGVPEKKEPFIVHQYPENLGEVELFMAYLRYRQAVRTERQPVNNTEVSNGR